MDQELQDLNDRATALLRKFAVERVQPKLWAEVLDEGSTRLEAGGVVTPGYLIDVYLNKVIEAAYEEEQGA